MTFCFYDPLDPHNPYSMFEALVDDAKRLGVPLELSVKRNSGRYYNMLNVGEEALSFFQGKRKSQAQCRLQSDRKENLVLADFYASPFIYVYDSSNKERWYSNLIDSIRNEYRMELYAELPLVEDTLVDEKMMSTKNIFMIGAHFQSSLLNNVSEKFLKEYSASYSNHGGAAVMSVHKNCWYGNRTNILYTSYPLRPFRYAIRYPWKDGLYPWIDQILQ